MRVVAIPGSYDWVVRDFWFGADRVVYGPAPLWDCVIYMRDELNRAGGAA